MKERPIKFSAPMVRAILEGRKTQTRRVVKCDGIDLAGPCGNRLTGDAFLAGRDWVGNLVLLRCPYGERGDRLVAGNGLTLEITSVRVERLQDISEEDAVKEGVVPFAASRHTPANFRDGFTVLWQSIYGPGSWDANPFVWVLEFKRVEDVK